MTNSLRLIARLEAVQSYLVEEFPEQVKGELKNVITVSHAGIHHQIVLQPEFLQKCPDYVSALRDSELADHIREVRSEERRFLVMWNDLGTRVRSTPAKPVD